MAFVTRDEFEFRSELEVVHLPTGAVLHAYPYVDPDDMLRSIKIHWGRTSAAGLTDYAEQIRRVGSQLLLERADRAARIRRPDFVAA